MSTTTTTTTDGGWQLQGDAAENYESYLVPAIFGAMSRRLVAAAELSPGETVLDVGCGTGIVARTAAGVVGPAGAVRGVDINPDMLATARRVAADTAGTITFRQADAADLPFDDATFDVVVCQEVLQFVEDPTAALSEMQRVAVPGGRIAISVLRPLDRNPVYATFSEALGERAGPAAEAMMASPFAFGDREALRGAATAAGLEDVRILIAVGEERYPSVEAFVQREAASSPLAGPLGELADDDRAAMVAALQDQLAPHRDDGGLCFHNETHLLTARA